MMVERLFLAVPRGCLQFVIVVFPDHTHLLFFIFKPEVHSSSKMFVITKWTNQVRFCLGYLWLSGSDEIKCIQQFLQKLLMNFKNLEKCDISKNT